MALVMVKDGGFKGGDGDVDADVTGDGDIDGDGDVTGDGDIDGDGGGDFHIFLTIHNSIIT